MRRALLGTRRYPVSKTIVCVQDGVENVDRRVRKLGEPLKQKKKQVSSNYCTNDVVDGSHAGASTISSDEQASLSRSTGRKGVHHLNTTFARAFEHATVAEEMDGSLFDHSDAVSPAAWYVLHTLRKNGHENYLVGGTVRDFILQQTPKDFDIVTSAEPEQIKKMFPRKSRILGKRFPIVHVRHKNEILEVSSFRTNCDDESQIPLDYAALFLDEQIFQEKGRKKRKGRKSQKQNDATWSMARRQNALKRDFTVNALLYDPFTRILFDYVGGVEDCQNTVIRTIGSPAESFKHDPARILRAIRLSSRLDMRIDDETREEMIRSRKDVSDISHGRLQMELHAMFAYGASSPAFSLLEEFEIVSIMLPMHHDICIQYSHGKDIILSLFSAMDKHSNVEHPVDAVVWNGVAFSALVFATIQDRYGTIEWNSINGNEVLDIVDEISIKLLCNRPNDDTVVLQLLSRNSIETTTHMLKFLFLQRITQKAKEPYHSFSSRGRSTRANKGLVMLEHILHNYCMTL